jgi:hypothetical protein
VSTSVTEPHPLRGFGRRPVVPVVHFGQCWRTGALAYGAAQAILLGW